MKIDLHTHSIASGHAYSTIKEMAESASARGIEYMAITDHGITQDDAPQLSYFRNFCRLPKEINGVKILKGVEANVINNKGEIDIPDDVLQSLDVVIFAFHLNCGYEDLGIEKNTEVALQAMKNPYVKIMAHPYAKYFDFDLEKIVRASIENDILIELNVSYLEGERFSNKRIFNNLKKTMKLLKEAGRKILLTSDAHNHLEVGDFSKALAMLDDLGLEEDDFINGDVDSVLDFLGIDKSIKN